MRRALDGQWPQERRKPRRRESRLDPYKPLIDGILQADLDAPAKQRHTAQRIFDRLVDEHGADDISYPMVRSYVKDCRPGIEGAHEKGGVEGQIGYFRRNHFVPVPEVASLAELNAMVDQWDRDDEARRLRSRTRTIGEYFAAEQHLLAPLPTEPFETGRWFCPRVNRFSQISIRGNTYSVPVRFIGRQLRVLLHANDLIVYDGRNEITRHERLGGVHGSRLVLDHYLEALLRKPGAFPGSTALEQVRSAGRFTPIHGKWWSAAKAAHGDAAGTRALIEVLLLARHMEHEQVVAGLAAAYRAGALTAAAVALEARKLAEGDGDMAPQARPTSRPVTSGQGEGPTASVTFLADWKLSHLPPDDRPPPSVSHYDQLLKRPGRTAGEKEGS